MTSHCTSQSNTQSTVQQTNNIKTRLQLIKESLSPLIVNKKPKLDYQLVNQIDHDATPIIKENDCKFIRPSGDEIVGNNSGVEKGCYW